MARLRFSSSLIVVACISAIIGEACGSSGHSSTSSTTATSSGSSTSSTVGPGSGSTSSTAGVAAPTTSSAAAGTGTGAAAGAPGVANGANLTAKPQIAAGQGPKPTKLVIKDLVVGKGPSATSSSTVSVQYIGVNFDDGKEFDSTWSRGGQPTNFSLSGVIPGFAMGITGMNVGGRRELVIPPDLGYGAQGTGPVGPNETLVFVIDLVAVS